MLTYLVIYIAMSLGGFVAILMLKDADGNPVEAIADSNEAATRPIALDLMRSFDERAKDDSGGIMIVIGRASCRERVLRLV